MLKKGEVRQLTVKYDGDPDEDLDRKITEFFEKWTGFRWYAQGFDFLSRRRDIAFEETKIGNKAPLTTADIS